MNENSTILQSIGHQKADHEMFIKKKDYLKIKSHPFHNEPIKPKREIKVPKTSYNMSVLHNFIDVTQQSALLVNDIFEEYQKLNQIRMETKACFQKYYCQGSSLVQQRQKLVRELKKRNKYVLGLTNMSLTTSKEEEINSEQQQLTNVPSQGQGFRKNKILNIQQSLSKSSEQQYSIMSTEKEKQDDLDLRIMTKELKTFGEERLMEDIFLNHMGKIKSRLPIRSKTDVRRAQKIMDVHRASNHTRQMNHTQDQFEQTSRFKNDKSQIEENQMSKSPEQNILDKAKYKANIQRFNLQKHPVLETILKRITNQQVSGERFKTEANKLNQTMNTIDLKGNDLTNLPKHNLIIKHHDNIPDRNRISRNKINRLIQWFAEKKNVNTSVMPHSLSSINLEQQNQKELKDKFAKWEGNIQDKFRYQKESQKKIQQLKEKLYSQKDKKYFSPKKHKPLDLIKIMDLQTQSQPSLASTQANKTPTKIIKQKISNKSIFAKVEMVIKDANLVDDNIEKYNTLQDSCIKVQAENQQQKYHYTTRIKKFMKQYVKIRKDFKATEKFQFQ